MMSEQRCIALTISALYFADDIGSEMMAMSS